ncbi:MAG TPA: type II toxin-antitoxin system RelB/DinJ family antitoxin [Thermodesulfovibrionia bacterium]|nr:type II toxin-antitoxin system RelB/DinJ family antitoxin [Thermodesulfovibrionia bacterium]
MVNKFDMLPKKKFIKIQVEQKLKEETEAIFRNIGLTTTEAIRLFLDQVRLHGSLPFQVEIKSQYSKNDDLLLPNEKRQAAIDSVYDD